MACETFYDGPFSLATIDTLDSGNIALGHYKWWTHNAFPNYPGGTSTITSPNCPACIWNYGAMNPTPSGDYSISGGNLTLAPASNAPYAGLPIMLSTIRYSATSPSGYIGQTFKPPFYVEFVVTAASTSSSGGEPNAIIWMVPIEFLTAGVGATYHFPEFDLCEFAFGCGYIHDWAGTGSASPSTATADNSYGVNIPYSGSASRLGFEIVDAASNGGVVGFQKVFIDDVEQTSKSLQWFAGAGTTPATTPSSPNGTIFEGNFQSFALQLGAGVGKNLTIQQIRVWQR